MTVRPPAGFEWDCRKYELNIRAHRGLKFDEAMFVSQDQNALDYEMRWEDGESRWSTIGIVLGRLLYVSYPVAARTIGRFGPIAEGGIAGFFARLFGS